MLRRENGAKLVEAVRSMTNREEGNIKCWLKNSLYYHLMKAAEILQGEALMVKGDAGKSKVEEMDHFMKLLRHNQKRSLVMQNIASTKRDRVAPSTGAHSL